MSASGSGSLVRSQSRSRLGLPSCGALTEVRGSLSKMAHSSSRRQEASVLATGNSPYDMVADFPQRKQERKSQEETPMTFMSYSQKSYTVASMILSVLEGRH